MTDQMPIDVDQPMGALEAIRAAMDVADRIENAAVVDSRIGAAQGPRQHLLQNGMKMHHALEAFMKHAVGGIPL